jgi:leucyl-tRNA synthetase
MFLLKATPPEDSMEWTDDGIAGRVRFLDRVWRIAEPALERARAIPLDCLPAMPGEPQVEIVRALHTALRSGSEESATRRFHFNTTLARLDELVNALSKFSQAGGADDPAFLYAVHALPLVLAPFAPHIAEELWERLGYDRSVHLERWIPYDPAALALTEIEIVVQVNGKVRARLLAAPGAIEEDVLARALADAKVAEHVRDKMLQKHIYVPDKLLNLVVA